MRESPEYLQNQRRHLDALHRRTRLFLDWYIALWCVFFSALAIASVLDGVLELGWNLSADLAWIELAFAAFGGVFWLFGRMILSIMRGVSRRMYGPGAGNQPE